MRYVKDSPLEIGFRVWQLRPPAPSLTVIVKGTFDPAAGDPAPFAEEQVPPTAELYYQDDVERSLRMPSDFALLKPRGECFVVGKAYAPGGNPVTNLNCSFKIGSIEKRFAVLGERTWSRGLVRSLPPPQPFTEMELVMDRAFGGEGYAPNPWGRGRDEVDGVLAMPNLEQPHDLMQTPRARPDPVIVGPLPVGWPDRMRYAGTYDQSYMKERWPWLPRDFDWRFFLEAPRDQQLGEGFWRGDERIELFGLHPTKPSIRSRLPGIEPRVFLDVRRPGQPRRFDEVPLKLDTVTWDAEIGKLLLVWRGLLEVPSESLEEIPHLFVAHEPEGARRRPAAELEARCDRLLEDERAEEIEAEGEEPTTEEPEAPEADEEPSPEPTSEERELERKLAEAEAKLAALGVATDAPQDEPAEPPEPPDPAKLRERLAASGALTPELEAMLGELEEEEEPPPTPDDVEEEPATPDPVGRALLEARIAAGEPLTELDLTGADLSAMDLSGRDLSGSILAQVSLAASKLVGCVLVGCTLAESELVDADLSGANLSGADLRGANLGRASLAGSILEDADLEGARLVGARLSGVRAARATFTGADLSQAVLERGDLAEADFERAVLERADLSEANLKDATLEQANAEGARFERAVMTKSRGEGLRAKEARFGSIDAEDSFWERAELSRASFAFAKLARADFTEAVLIGTEMDGCAMRQARFDRANAHSLRARRADLMEASFESAELAYADLRGASLFGAELWRARTDSALFELADLTRTKLER